MKHVWAILAKFIIMGVVILSFLSIFDPPLSTVLLITVVTTIISYVVGDLGILRMGNTAATIGDFILSFATIGFLSYFMVEQTWTVLVASFFATLAITAVEILFHIYMKNRIYPDREQRLRLRGPAPLQNVKYAAEFAEENEMDRVEQENTNK
ncbi:YndM family protein [Bacillus litorisediminis]|uniref:YndM family protein n=1 Tax=Bacillus litorisediminis TaxID=2922713 RepID=UPI001FAC2BA0|nr:YndM family protein [Bacillus litorisediminis]